MRTVTLEVYRFNELSEESQGRFLSELRAHSDLWGWKDEWCDSAKEFCKIAPVDVKSADFDHGTTYTRWTEEQDLSQLEGIRAWKWLNNNGWFDLAQRNNEGECTLTGYAGDCPLFDPIHALRDTPEDVPSLDQLFFNCIASWIRAAQEDLEFTYSDENLKELAESNYEFLYDGRVFEGT